jgi:cytochrome c556
MNRTAWLRAALLAAAALVAAPLLASPADVVKTRVAGLRELGAAFKAINDGLRTSEPQTIMIQQSARQVRNAASQMVDWFPAGSGPQPGVKTAARPEIWTQADKFKTAQTAFTVEAAKFQTVVNSGNVDAIRAEVPKLGGTCKSCHENFRVPASS